MIQNPKSDHECFWESGCSDSRRCKTAGLCVAAAQNALSTNGTLQKQLAERDAALARCVEATKTAMSFIRLHHWNDNAPGRGVWDLDAAGIAYDGLKSATSIPASAQATAKVLAAAAEG